VQLRASSSSSQGTTATAAATDDFEWNDPEWVQPGQPHAHHRHPYWKEARAWCTTGRGKDLCANESSDWLYNDETNTVFGWQDRGYDSEQACKQFCTRKLDHCMEHRVPRCMNDNDQRFDFINNVRWTYDDMTKEKLKYLGMRREREAQHWCDSETNAWRVCDAKSRNIDIRGPKEIFQLTVPSWEEKGCNDRQACVNFCKKKVLDCNKRSGGQCDKRVTFNQKSRFLYLESLNWKEKCNRAFLLGEEEEP
jgi:hypothetical protein